MQNVSADLKEKYDTYYDDSIEPWRLEGARKKTRNISKIVGANTFDTLIEVGAGEGSILRLLDQTDIANEFYALEISTTGIEKINAREIKRLKEVRLFDGYSIPYADKQFDLAICSHVLEHVEHPRLLLREIKRISKQQVFEIPIDYSPKIYKKVNHFLSYGHINIFTPPLFKFLLLSEKFKIKNEIFSMYSFQTIKLSANRNFIKLSVLTTKWIIWQLISKLRYMKPNTYTVYSE